MNQDFSKIFASIGLNPNDLLFVTNGCEPDNSKIQFENNGTCG
mgnify:CR=1